MSGTIIPEYYPAESVIIGSLMGTLVSFTAGVLQIPTKLLRARWRTLTLTLTSTLTPTPTLTLTLTPNP